MSTKRNPGPIPKAKPNRLLAEPSRYDPAKAKELAQREDPPPMRFEDAVTTDGGIARVIRPDALDRSLVGGSLP